MLIERRVSAAVAAKHLGVSPRHILRLIRAGSLDGVDVRQAGARRARWKVSVRSIAEFLRTRSPSIPEKKDGLNGHEVMAYMRAGATGDERGSDGR